MSELLSDQQVIDRLLQHIADKTTDRSERTWSEPVRHYNCPQRFSSELNLLRRLAVPFCTSASTAKPGDYVSRNAAGVPLLAVRGDDGRARVFRNACRHRGMQVAEGSGCARAFMCRYHGWTYQLDGALRHVPHEEGFPGLDKSSMGLSEVACSERHGLVFVSQAAEAEPAGDLSEIEGRITDQHRQFEHRVRRIECNWKGMLETFLEGYHIKPAHKETFFPFGYDNTTLVERFGRNSRVVFPFQRIEEQRNVPSGERKLTGNVTMVYHLFPNSLLVCLSHHLNLVVLEPVDIRTTDMHFYALAHESVTEERARKDAAFVDLTGTAEDREIACSIQKTIDADLDAEFTFGHFEGAITHFHSNLTQALAQR